MSTPSKKPMGRPPGSKNKPKSTSIIKEHKETPVKPFLFSIPVGNDIVQDLISLAQSHQSSLTVLAGSGLVTDVTLFDPLSRSSYPPIEGPLHMISLNGTYLNANGGHVPPQFITNPAFSSFSIQFFRDNGKVIGGIVGGRLKAAGVVTTTVTLLRNPDFCRLSMINGNYTEIEECNPESVAPESSYNVVNVHGFDVVDRF